MTATRRSPDGPPTTHVRADGPGHAAGLVSADEVFASVGIVSWTGPKEPGFPITSGDFWCGKFRDSFDWSELPVDYLVRIGAVFGGVLQDKPK